MQERVAADGLVLPAEREFVDEGYSGATLVRPALERLRDLAAAGVLDRLYVHSPDRLARKYAYQVLLLEEFQRAGIEVVFLNRAIGRPRRTSRSSRCRGWWPSMSGPRSWSAAGVASGTRPRSVDQCALPRPIRLPLCREGRGRGTARYEIVLEEARVVRQIFAWVGQERVTIGEVCRRLTAAGEPTRTGKTVWDRTTVWTMLTTRLHGKAAFGKTHAGPFAPRLRAQRGRRRPSHAARSRRRMSP